MTEFSFSEIVPEKRSLKEQIADLVSLGARKGFLTTDEVSEALALYCDASSGEISPRSQKWSTSAMDRSPQVAMMGWEARPVLPRKAMLPKGSARRQRVMATSARRAVSSR